MAIPAAPTKEELQAKEKEYMDMSIKDLRALCGARQPPVSTAGCIEKREIVDKLMHDDQRLFMEKLESAVSPGVLGSCLFDASAPG